MSALGVVATIVKYVFLVLFTLLLVGQLTALVVVQASQTVLLDARFYKTELDRAGVYDYAYASFSQKIQEQGGNSTQALIGLSGISMEDVFTKPWIKTQAENLIDHALAYINGQSATAELVVDLTDPKARLMAAAQTKIAQLQPDGNGSTALMAQLKAQLDEKVPDRIDLAAQAGGMQALEQARSSVQTAKTATLGMAIVALVLAGLIAVLARKSVNAIARWLGAACFIAGALSLLAIGVAKEKAVEMLSAYAHTPEGQIMLTVAKDGSQAVQDAAFPMAAALIVLGVVGIAASFLIKQTKAAQIPQEAAAGKKSPASTKTK